MVVAQNLSFLRVASKWKHAMQPSEMTCILGIVFAIAGGCASGHQRPQRNVVASVVSFSGPAEQRASQVFVDAQKPAIASHRTDVATVQVSPASYEASIRLVEQPVLDPTGWPDQPNAADQTYAAGQSVDPIQVAAYTLQELEQLALSNNPSLTGAQATMNKAAGLRHQVGIGPNPTGGYFGQQIANRNTDQHGVFLEQEFVRGDKLRLNREVLAHTLSAQQYEAQVQMHRVLTDVRVLFFEAIAAQKQLQMARSLEAIAQRGVEIAKARMKAEEGSRIEVLQSETLLSEIALSVEQTEIVYSGAWKDLAATIGLPELTTPSLIGELGEHESGRNWESTFQQIAMRSPELSVARAIICEKASLIKRQQNQAIPNLTGNLGTGYDRGTESGMINLEFSAPLPICNTNRGNISAAYADYMAAVENLKRIEQSIRSRLARVAQEYESSQAAVRKYEEEILPKLSQALELSEDSYRAGELDFLQVLLLRRGYFESMIRNIDSKAQLAQAAAKIDGLLLTGGLEKAQDFTDGDGIRGASFGGQ